MKKIRHELPNVGDLHGCVGHSYCAVIGVGFGEYVDHRCVREERDDVMWRHEAVKNV